MGVRFDQFPSTRRPASLRPRSRLDSVSKKTYCVRGAIGVTDAPLHLPLRPRVALDKAGVLGVATYAAALVAGAAARPSWHEPSDLR
jgi:hypothetical protein